MKLDRKLQHEILQRLADAFPNDAMHAFREIEKTCDEETLVANMLYLEEHGLIVSGISRALGGEAIINTGQLRATSRGMDFLLDDGGLSAVLGVVTIKLHDDTLKSLIEARILQSDLSQPDKKKYLDALRELPAETTKHLVLKLVDMGLAAGPAAIAAIGKILDAA